jgi:F0F1-type ATP synthase membrane subunit b/b'
LAAALGWLLFKPMRRAIDTEREQREREVAEASRLKQEAAALADEARAARDSAARDAETRHQAMLRTAQQQAKALVEAAHERERAERLAFERELSTKRQADAEALADTVGVVVAESVRQLLASLSGPDLDDALVRKACQELGTLPAEARAAAVVESARVLSPEATRLLHTTLGSGVEPRIVDELGAGVRITTPAGQIDATAVAVARRAARSVRALGSQDEGEVRGRDG